MADNSSTKYFERAYREAASYSQKIIKECDDIQADYLKMDRLYREFSITEIALIVIGLVAGVVGLILHDLAFTYINIYLFARWRFGVLEEYFSLLYNLAFCGLTVLALWCLFQLLYSRNRRHELDDMAKLSAALKSQISNIEKRFKEIITQIFDRSSEVSLEKTNQYEDTVRKYREKAEKIGEKTSQISTILICLLFAVIMIVHFLVLGRYAVSSLASTRYNYPVAMVICSSYFLLLIVLYEFQLSLFTYLKKAAKGVTLAAFAVYQALMGFEFWKYRLFLETPGVRDLLFAEEDTGWVRDVLAWTAKYLLPRGSLVLIITSILCGMFIIRTNPEREIYIKENGLPMTDGSVIKGNSLRFVLGAAYAIIAPKFMAEICNEGVSFGRIVLFIVISIIWAYVSYKFKGLDEGDYQKRIGWVKNSFFLSYMFLTLALVPGFGVGSILLLLLQLIVPYLLLLALVII